jgi:hypothetical protein
VLLPYVYDLVYDPASDNLIATSMFEGILEITSAGAVRVLWRDLYRHPLGIARDNVDPWFVFSSSGGMYRFLPFNDCNSNGIPDECDIDSGTSTDLNGNGVPDECSYEYPECDPPSTSACPNVDVDCNNVVDVFDLGVIRNTANWNYPAVLAANPRADVNRDGVVNGLDIAAARNTACWGQ